MVATIVAVALAVCYPVLAEDVVSAEVVCVDPMLFLPVGIKNQVGRCITSFVCPILKNNESGELCREFLACGNYVTFKYPWQWPNKLQ